MTETIPAMLFFIGSVVVVIGFVGVAGKIVDYGGQAIQSKGSEVAQSLRGGIDIINVNASGSIVVYAENTGSVVYDMNQTKITVDGQWINGTIAEVRGNGDAFWDPGEVIRINSTSNLIPGWHEAKILAQKISSPNYRFVR